jgi:hypothetical protein
MPPSPATTPAAPKKEPPNIIPFRAILETPYAPERIKLYKETRAQIASLDTGLDEWVTTLRSEHPELANITSQLGYAVAQPGTPASQADASQGGQIPSQQPHHRQHPSVSSSSLHTLQGGVRGSSDLRHSSKGKELLMAAGKAGRGLLGKGKHKLRGTGDKVFF